MKILAPAASAREAEVLIRAGAEELYCGINMERWAKSYGRDIWLNRRGPKQGNMEPEELKRLTSVAHENQVRVFLTVNQPSYDPEGYNVIIKMAYEWINDYEVDGLILGDPGLILAIKEQHPEINVHASSLASILNRYSAKFFQSLGVSRIIFPRYVSYKDIAGMIKGTNSELEYEAFIFNDGCVFEEGYCFTSHAFKGAFCHEPHWGYKALQKQEVMDNYAGESLADHLKDYRLWLWLGIKNGGDGTSHKGHPMGMCGLCALPELKALGVNSLKIVGREVPLAKKKASVELVQKAIRVLDEVPNPELFRMTIVKLRDIPHLCKTGYMCYYRTEDSRD